MNLTSLTVILPCHSLEDLSLDRDSAEANQILSAWTAFYHPALITKFRGPPGWRGAISAPSPPTGHLMVLPDCCRDDLPDFWLEKTAKEGDSALIQGLDRREEIIQQALAAIQHPSTGLTSQEIVPDFLALGYTHLLVELLTRQLRYMSNLDEAAFQSSTLSAAEKWAEGDVDSAKEHLTSAFDLLTEAREYFYPVETYLLDLTLVAPTTIGEALREEIGRNVPTNLLVSGSTLEAIAQQAPETMSELRSAVDEGRVSIAGGEYEELELPLPGPEATLEQFRKGRETYQRLLGKTPRIFGRRRFGLSPLLPQTLQKVGFTGACHFTLDDGRFPSGNQSRISWQGNSGAKIDSLVRLPLDASRAGAFLSLAETLGNTMDLDHASTAVFAHWPGASCQWYDDLIRACGYSPVLGRFIAIDEYFKDTKYVGQATRYTSERYRSPFLRQAVRGGATDPISKWRKAAREEIEGQIDGSLHTMAAMLAGKVAEKRAEGNDDLQAIRDALAPNSEAADSGCLLVNPLPFARKICVDISEWEKLPPVGGPVVAAEQQDDGKLALVNVPGMGFAWIDPDMPPAEEASESQAKKSRKWFGGKKPARTPPPMAEENVLRNEFFEVKIDPVTGALHSLHDYRTRDNRLALQLAYRRAAERRRSDEWDEDPEMLYSVMAADAVEMRAAGPMIGEMTVRGRLLDHDGTCLARYEQTLRARRGSRVLEIEVTLDPERLPDGDPWTTYYAARFAWGDATADLFTGIGTTSLAAEASQLEAPYYVDVRGEKISTTILTGGLPYHRRFGLRKMDTLLIVPGETQRAFRLGIGVDTPYPHAAAIEFLAPETTISHVGPATGARSGWLCHLGAKNVVATAWEPLVHEQAVGGVRVRLAETENRAVDAALTCFRQVASARKVNFLGEQPEELEVDDDRVTVPLAGHEWSRIEIEFVK